MKGLIDAGGRALLTVEIRAAAMLQPVAIEA